MIRVHLPPDDAEHLDREFRSAADRRYRDRLQIVLMALRHVGRMYPKEGHPRVVLVIDNAPWHRGEPIDEALRDNPHLEFKRLPAYRPQLNPVERFWKKLRRRATHNRLFDTLADLKQSVRASLSYFRTVRQRVRSLIEGRPRKTTNRTASPGA